MSKRTWKIVCLLLAAALLLGACVSRSIPAPQGEAAPPSGEDAQSVGEERQSAPGSLPYERVQPVTPADLTGMVSNMAVSLDGMDLSFPQTFAVTRPLKKITTTLEAYYITGTSDPGRAVYIGDTEIPRPGTKGAFGVHVQLQIGVNTFTLSQGGETAAVTIVREKAPGVTPINAIVQKSAYPAVQGSVKAGQELLLECTAPSGGSVTAAFGGKTATLSQVAQAQAGIPATFRGSMVVDGDYTADETVRAGKVAYTLRYNGASKTVQTTGDVYVAGKNTDIAVQVTNYYGFVYNDPKDLADFREQLKEGSVDYIASQDNSHYQLRSGGYLPVEQAEILLGKADADNRLGSVSFKAGGNFESYAFSGTGTPAFYTKRGDGTFAITFFNTSGTPRADVSASKLFDQASVTDNVGSVSYVFTLKSGGLWGYNVYYDGTDTVLRCAYKPKAGGGAQALLGVTVVLDPGHGGDEPGALGVAGETGPMESTINLAHALSAKAALEELGARVLMTRTDNTTVSLDNRLKFFDESGADLFISLHHNSLVESTDASKVSGMELYYHTPNSQNFASGFMSALAVNLNRNNRWVQQSYYRVTLSSHAPAMLLELAYISHPLEYERATSKTSIQQAGQAVARSVAQALS